MKINLNMNRIIYIIFTAIIFFSAGSLAQVRAGFQGSSVVPTGELETYAEVGYGGALNLSFYPVTTDFEFTFTAGYFRAGLKQNLKDLDVDLYMIPVTAGVRYNFGDVNVIPFVGGEAGFINSKYLVLSKSVVLGNSLSETKEWNFTYTYYTGFRMNLSETLDFEVTAKYNTVITKYIGRGFINIMSGLTYRI